MKKLAPHLSNKRGSMLMLTLIVFMVILILGMTMITSMLYSQGENTMQINEQKAYYAALSAVDSVKAYFLNPELNVSPDKTIESPYDLIGTTGTYNLKTQEIDEDTTVEIDIRRDENDREYIFIEATGRCNGEESVVTAKMREEVQEGSLGGLYDSQVVFGCTEFSTSLWNTDLKRVVKGDIYITDKPTDTGNTWTGTIMHLNKIKEGHEIKENIEEGNASIYIKTKKGMDLSNNYFKNIYMQLEDGNNYVGVINNTADNIYIRNTGNSQLQFTHNITNRETQLYLVTQPKYMEKNTSTERFIYKVNGGKYGTSFISQFITNKLYMMGIERIEDDWEDEVNYKHLYIDSNVKVDENFKFAYEYIKPSDISLDVKEQQISDAFAKLQEIDNIFKNPPSWNKDIVIQNAVLIDDGVKSNYEEYYDPNQNVRWIFSNNTGWSEAIVVGDIDNWGDSKYYLDNNNQETVFFISQAHELRMFAQKEQSIYNLHIYAPNASFSFINDFEYFGGSIIANSIQLQKGPGMIEFKLPETVKDTGAPWVSESSDSIGGSSDTTYTYHFEEYIENDKK